MRDPRSRMLCNVGLRYERDPPCAGGSELSWGGCGATRMMRTQTTVTRTALYGIPHFPGRIQ